MSQPDFTEFTKFVKEASSAAEPKEEPLDPTPPDEPVETSPQDVTNAKDSEEPPNPDLRKAEKRAKTKRRLAEWYAVKKTVQDAHPRLSAAEQLIMAKKLYNQACYCWRSPKSLHKQAWLLRHPAHNLTDEQLKAELRRDLIGRAMSSFPVEESVLISPPLE